MASRAKSFEVDLFTLTQVNRLSSEPRRRSVFEVNMGIWVDSEQHRVTIKGTDIFATVDAALRRTLCVFFPCLERVAIIDRMEEMVKLKDGFDGSTYFGTKVRVSFTDGKKLWTAEKTSENVPNAILDALCEGLQVALLLV